MWVFLFLTAGVCVLVITWAMGLTSDVGGLIALAFLGIGVLAQMATRPREDRGAR
jgi:hypothetical protein